MLKRKRSFPSSQVYCFHPGTPPKSSAVAEGHKSISAGEENEMPVRKRMRTDSFERQSSAQQDLNSGAFTESNTDVEIKRSSLVAGRKRKHSPAPGVADNYQPEEREMPVAKKKRTSSPENQLSLKTLKWSSSTDPENQTSDAVHERNRDYSQYSIASLEDDGLQTPPSSDLKVHLPKDRQVQSAPAEVHFSPVSSEESTNDDDILSRYEIGKLLGMGGFGDVYEGKRLEDGLEVAVKIASKSDNIRCISIPGHPDPLPLEVGLLILANAEPKVPEIIQLLEWQDQPKRYIMILERPSPCQDLFAFTESHGDAVDEDTARFIIAQTTKAADTCFHRGVFHRDIKLENLLINPDTLQVKLIDFGCGDLMKESGYEQFCGTRIYCPPEYYSKRKYHGKPATVYSLGVLLFRLVCGRFPHWTEMDSIADGTWCSPVLSKECCDLIQALLRDCPNQRINLREIIFHEWFMVKK